MSKEFEIRTYGFNELAQLYFPNVTKHSATKMFNKWINASSTLVETLKSLDWKKNAKKLTPKQVKALIGHFDPP
jgi:hypothetical protein